MYLNESFVLFENVYSPKVLANIKQELLVLKDIASPAHPGTAAPRGVLLKTGKNVLMDVLYRGCREQSTILTANRCVFNMITDEIIKKVRFFGHARYVNEDFTNINYYANGQEYREHYDVSVLTAITFFKLGEYQGGDFKLTELDYTVPGGTDNVMIVFPSCLLHQASPIVAEPNNYRVSMAQFLTYKSKD